MVPLFSTRRRFLQLECWTAVLLTFDVRKWKLTMMDGETAPISWTWIKTTVFLHKMDDNFVKPKLTLNYVTDGRKIVKE